MTRGSIYKSTVAAMALMTGAGQAMAAAEAPSALEEITVTAQKRGAEALQDVALSIQAISGNAIERQQIFGFDDYARLVPSLSAINQGPGQTQITIRGITTGRIAHIQPQNKSTVGIYFNDIPVTANAFNPDLTLFDIERIEVLRGPQGTLYGAGSMAGTVRVLTKQPNLEKVEGVVDGMISTTKSGGENYAAKGMINLPVAEGKFAVRGVAYYQKNSGFIDNIVNGDKNYNDDDAIGGRVAAKFQASDSFDLTVSLIYQDASADGRQDEFLPGLAQAMGVNGGVDVSAPGENLVINDELQVAKFAEDPFDDEFYIANLAFNWNLSWATLSSSTSYFDRDFDNILDDTFRGRINLGPVLADGVTPLVSQVVVYNKVKDFVQETRLASMEDSAVTWLIGGYYQKQKRSFVEEVPLPGMEELLVLYGLPPSSFFGAQDDSLFDGYQEIKQRQYALFGELSFNVTDQVAFTVGARAFDWKQDFYLFHAGLANGGVDIIDDSTSDSGINPKFNLSYQPNEDVLVYLQAAKGFRLGGINEPVPTTGPIGEACSAEVESRGLGALPRSFGSDSLWNYELGAKTSWLDNRLIVNAAAYYVKWSDVQTTTFLQCGFTTIFNAGEVTSKGVEVELSAALTEGLVLKAGGSFTDSKLTSSTDEANAGIGSRAPNVPRWLLNASLDYTTPLANDDYQLFVRGDVQYTGNSYTEFEGGALRTEIPSHVSGNFSIGVQTDRWETSLFVKNIWDERIVAGVDTDRNVPPTFTRARPRTIGINSRLSF